MRRSAIALLASLLVLTACGARLSDEQRAALETTSADGGAIDNATGATRGTTTTTAPGGRGNTSTTAPRGGGGEGGGGEGGGESPGGEAVEGGGGGGGGGDGSTCGGGGASDVGVTEGEIKLGNVSTISGPIPGFGQTGVNGAQAYLNFVNATGGVCGRQISLVTADDRLQSGTNKSEHDKLKDQVLGFVGGTTVVDDGGAQSIDGTNVAYTGLAISEAMIRTPNNFPTTPIDLADGGNNSLEVLKYLKETEGITKGGIVWPDQASAKARIEGYRKDMERAGIEVVLDARVEVTQTSYAGVAANVEEAGVEILLTTLEITGMANLARDMKTNGYFPKVPFYGAQAYGRDFLARAGDAAEPTILGLTFAMLEDAGSVPMIQDFLSWYERTNPGADIDFFAIQSWVAADMYVRALRAVDGPPTRDKVLAQLQGLTEYDAGGFIAPINPAGKKGANCFLIAKVRGGQWYRAHPAQPGFDCSYA